MARPKAALVVTKVDRQVLDSMAHRARTAPQLARRARIVLACATGLDNTTVAKKLRMSKPTVGRWRQRFIDKGVDGLLDEPRPGAPRTINDTQVEAVVTRTLETTPRGATHWSTRTLAKATGVSPMSVHRIWQAFGLQPHRTKSFKLSPDPLLIDKVRDIVGLYLNPPQHAAVFCVDEKPQIQALDRTAPLLPLRPGQAERRTHDYKRHGTTSLFAALEVKTGHVLGQIRRRHRAIEFRAFLTALDVQVPADLDVHVIMDNYGTHKTALIGVVARIVTGPHDAHRQDPHRPMRYDTGRPRAVIRLRISQPRATSLPCPAELRARRPSPMMDLYRKNVFSTRP